jgi:hypothetical protein
MRGIVKAYWHIGRWRRGFSGDILQEGRRYELLDFLL